jgi:hypothetical protein
MRSNERMAQRCRRGEAEQLKIGEANEGNWRQQPRAVFLAYRKRKKNLPYDHETLNPTAMQARERSKGAQAPQSGSTPKVSASINYGFEKMGFVDRATRTGGQYDRQTMNYALRRAVGNLAGEGGGGLAATSTATQWQNAQSRQSDGAYGGLIDTSRVDVDARSEPEHMADVGGLRAVQAHLGVSIRYLRRGLKWTRPGGLLGTTRLRRSPAKDLPRWNPNG